MLGTSASSSISLSAAIRYSGSVCAGENVAPTAAVLRVMTPGTGAFNVPVVAGVAGAPGPAASVAGRTMRTSTWPELTRSPSPASTSVILKPGLSRATLALVGAARKPVTRISAANHDCVARTTITWTSADELASAGAAVVQGQSISPPGTTPSTTPRTAMLIGAKDF